MDAADPVGLYERATTHAAKVMSDVSLSQLDDATTCTDWNVQQLIDHMAGGTDYLLAALAGEAPPERSGRTAKDYNQGLAKLRTELRAPDGLERMGLSPLGFEWPVAHAAAGSSWML